MPFQFQVKNLHIPHNMLDSITAISLPDDTFFDEAIVLWERALAVSHPFLSRQEVDLQKLLIRHVFFYGLDFYAIRRDGKLLAFMATANDTIEMLYVDPDVHGQGCGRALVDYALQYDIRKINVYEENTQALAIYQHWGFVVIDRKEMDPWGQPHPILFLHKPI